MINPSRPCSDSRVQKTSKRSIFGLLFNPQLGPALTPMRDTTRVFVRLVAMVFSIYKLFPKDHPALRDETTPLSFSQVIRISFNNVRFTREGAPQAIIFFAVTGMMAFSGLMAVFALLSLFMGVAHADTVDPSAFQPEGSQDVAQAWIDYLFNGKAMSGYTNMGNAVPQGFSLQTALTKALAFYSDAILIVAAIILFYHLAAMIVETAHHGVPMGKRANQIWAPIRLVFAIGLLVPINGGLSTGQFLVIKIAEMGSGLASHTWDMFLTGMNNYAPQAIPPNSPIVTQIASDLIASEACMYDYNQRISVLSSSLSGLSSAQMTIISSSGQTIGGHIGTKFSFSTNDLQGQDLCGWYFIPDAPAADASNPASAVTTAAYAAEAAMLNAAISKFALDAQQIKYVMPVSAGGAGGTTPITLDVSSLNDVIAYQKSVGDAMAKLASTTQSTSSAVINQIQPYGWVFAGTLLPTIERMQAAISNAVTAGMPETKSPDLTVSGNAHWYSGVTKLFGGTQSDQEWDILKQVATDLNSFNVLLSKSWAQKTATDNQCAAMLGLQDAAQGGSWGSSAMNVVLHAVDASATMNGVWTSGTGQPCNTNSTGSGSNTFMLGIDLTGPDILGQLVSLGHANLDVAFNLLVVAIGGHALGGVGGFIGGLIGGAAAGSSAGPLGTLAGGVTGAAVGGAVGSILSAFAGVLEFIATIFFACGFVLAFILPMFAFTRFFFAVLSWVGAIVEAVIAVPLVALAHLNPEGDGLPGASAKGAYFFIFNIFLRPVLTVFGLVAGLLIFMLAASFLTYAYSLAVAAAGGTAYGHEVLAKIVYSVLYVAMLYICANHSFAMIDHIPEHALRWMGASGQAMPRLGDADKLASFEAAVGAYAGSRGMGALTQGAKGLSQGAGQALEAGMGRDRKIAKLKSEAGDKEASDRHDEMISAIKGSGGGGSHGSGSGGSSTLGSGGSHILKPTSVTAKIPGVSGAGSASFGGMGLGAGTTTAPSGASPSGGTKPPGGTLPPGGTPPSGGGTP